MKIVVLVKQVPDTAADKRLDPDTLTVDRAAVDGLINEMDEYAVEEALKLAEKHGGEVTVLTVGPDDATDAYKKALQMGAHKAVFLTDPALPAPTRWPPRRAGQVPRASSSPDLIVMGCEASDATAPWASSRRMLAERLGLPQ